MPDTVWQAMLGRVRGEFAEMPCLRVTPTQAAALFGLQPAVSSWILERLTSDGFLSRTSQGEYVRKGEQP